MSGKTLSNGTLGLRFMQNAQRVKMQAEVEAEQAKIRDDAEWEVSKEIKEAWGLGAGPSAEKHEATIHEASYLPFLFAPGSDPAGGSSSGESSHRTAPFRGRRTFNARGQEVIAKDESDHDEDGAAAENDADTGVSNRRGTTRPASISGFKAPIPITKRGGRNARTKTAEMLIREDPVARPPPAQAPVPPADNAGPTGNGGGFRKPAGIDDPASRTTKSVPQQKRVREPDARAQVPPDARSRKKKRAES